MRYAIERLARVSYAFVMMNAAAVSGLVVLGLGRRVWR
jgi:hypothetical protein